MKWIWSGDFCDQMHHHIMQLSKDNIQVCKWYLHAANPAVKLAGGAVCWAVLFVGSQILEPMLKTGFELCLQYKPMWVMEQWHKEIDKAQENVQEKRASVCLTTTSPLTTMTPTLSTMKHLSTAEQT